MLHVSSNPLGDAGVAALAKALPPTLEQLFVCGVGCGDDGFVALAAALPALTRLRDLRIAFNRDVGARGWAALVGALPSLPALEYIYAASNSAEVAALAAARREGLRIVGV